MPLPVLLSLSTADTSEIRSIDTVFGSMDRALAKPVRIDSVCSTVMESAVRPKMDSFCFIMYVVVLRTTVLVAAEDVLEDEGDNVVFPLAAVPFRIGVTI